jgi:hypothetical protein
MTFAELMKRISPDGNMMAIAEVLAETNAILQDAPWYPSNDKWAHKTTRRGDEPAGAWRQFNQGISASRSETVQVQDVIGVLEAKSEIDVEIVDSAPNPQEARSQEDAAFVGGMSKEMANTILYGNAYTNPEEFNGLSVRLDALNSSLYNVIGGGGSGGDTTSIFVVTWGRDMAHMAYPPGTTGGLEMLDRGVREVNDASSNGYLAYQTWFKWRAGLVVRHPRAIGRIANLEITGASNTFDEDHLIDLLTRMELTAGTRIYFNRSIMAYAWKRLKDKTNVYFQPGDGLDAGGPPMYFNGIPVRRVDQISNAETAVA